MYKDEKGETSYLSFIFIDTTGKKTKEITKACNYLFGKMSGNPTHSIDHPLHIVQPLPYAKPHDR